MIKLPWIVGGSAVLLVSSLLWARQGIVITTDGKRFEGDVNDKGTSVDVVTADPSKPSGKSTASFQKAAIKDIVYADQVAGQVRQQLAKLPKGDVPERIKLAQWAMQNGAYDAAHDVLEDARKTDPNNRDVNSMLDTVNARLHLPPENRRPDNGPATKPAEEGGAGAAKSTTSAKPIREVTPEEINRIKQLEWDQKEPVKIKIDAETRKDFLAGSTMKPAEFAALSPMDQAIMILNNGKKDLASGVHIQIDPTTIANYHKIQRVILTGCAAAGCHSGTNAKGKNFYLFNGDTPAAYYSNFLTLQTFTMRVNEAQRFLVDRQNPESSLLLEYMLPLKGAQTPHPAVQNFKEAVKAKSDQRYNTVYNWIQSLPGILPNYDIDLSKEPKKKEEKR